MRSITELPHFESRNIVPASRGSCFTDYVAAYIATRIAPFSRSAYQLLVASLHRATILATILVMILAGCASAFAYPYKATVPLTKPVQGSSNRKAAIDVRPSPSVYLPGPTLRVEVYSTNPITPRVPEFLQEMIENMIVKNDPRLRIGSAADTSITLIITSITSSPGVETRTRSEYERIGATTVTDPETGISHTEDQFGYVEVPYQVPVLYRQMSVKCEVTDIATGILLYSNSFDSIYSDEHVAVVSLSARSIELLNNAYFALSQIAAGQILAQFSPRGHSEIVVLSSGKLKDASKLLASGLWSEALTLLSSMAAFKEPKDDAYRFYSIGVALEALAYKVQDTFERKQQLERAVESYRRAVELKPRENMFWAPKNRAESALLQAGSLAAQIEVFEEARKLRSTAASPDRVAAGSTGLFRQAGIRMPSGPALIDNQTVVQWVKSGRSTDYIIASIKHAPGTRFDLSEAAVLKLRRDGVSKSVLKAMANPREGSGQGIWRRVLTTAVSLWWLVPLLVR